MDFTFYFIVTCEFIDYTNNLVEKTEYGFITGDNITEVFEKLRKYYGNDIVKIAVELINDSGMIAVGNEDDAVDFKEKIAKYNEV